MGWDGRGEGHVHTSRPHTAAHTQHLQHGRQRSGTTVADLAATQAKDADLALACLHTHTPTTNSNTHRQPHKPVRHTQTAEEGHCAPSLCPIASPPLAFNVSAMACAPWSPRPRLWMLTLCRPALRWPPTTSSSHSDNTATHTMGQTHTTDAQPQQRETAREGGGQAHHLRHIPPKQPQTHSTHNTTSPAPPRLRLRSWRRCWPRWSAIP